jgi:hypothetical protein
VDDLLLLLGVEHALDQMDVNLWHCLDSFLQTSFEARNVGNMRKAAAQDFQKAMIYSPEDAEAPLIFGRQRGGAPERRVPRSVGIRRAIAPVPEILGPE